MATKRLTARNAIVYNFSLGDEVSGNGTTSLEKGKYYLITAMASTSGFPSGAKVGMTIVGNTTITPATGDKYKVYSTEKECDVRSVSLNFEAEELDIGTICDDINRYAKGMVDLSGTIEGILTVNKSEKWVSQFVDVVKQTSSAIEVTEQNDDKLLLDAVFNKLDNSDIPKLEFIAPIIVTSFETGVTRNEATTFSSNYRIAQDDEVNVEFLKSDKELHANAD